MQRRRRLTINPNAPPRSVEKEEEKEEKKEEIRKTPLIINSAKILPWGIIHNDYHYNVIYNELIWPSISHVLYANILPEKNHNSIRNTEDTEKAKKLSKFLFNSELKEIEIKSIRRAYNALLEAYPRYFKILKNTKNYKFIISEPRTKMKNLIEKCINVLYNIRGGNVDLNDGNPVLLPDFFNPFNNEININGRSFRNIITYMYYSLYVFLLEDETSAYNIITSLNVLDQYESSFNTLYRNFMSNKMSIIHELLKQKFKKRPNTKPQSYLNAAYALFSYIQVNDTGFLGPIISRTVNSFLWQNRQGFFPNEKPIDMNFMLSDQTILDWVVNVRVKDINWTMCALEHYLRKYIPTSRIFDVFKILFNPCINLDENMIISQCPDELKKRLKFDTKTLQSERGIYEMWCYISNLLLMCDKFKPKDITYSNFLKDMMNVDQNPSYETCKRAVINLIKVIKQINGLLLDPVLFRENEFSCIQSLLYIKNPIKYKKNKSIQSDLLFSDEFTYNINMLIQHLYNTNQSNATYSKINFYS
jgi:hypothetical protein